MVNKYKKIIVSLCIFLFSFTLVFDYNKKQVQAFDFVVTPAILWALGTLVLGTGVVALNHSQIYDMGQRVFDDFKLRNSTDDLFNFVDGVATGLKIGDKLLTSISNIVSSLPKIETEYVLGVPVYSTYDITLSKANIPLFTFTTTLGSFMELWAKSSVGGSHYKTLTDSYKEYRVSAEWFSGAYNWYLYVKNSSGEWVSYSDTYIARGKMGEVVNFGFRPARNTSATTESISSALSSVSATTTIPYDNDKVNENYNPGLLPQTLPYTDSKPGYLPIPNVIPNDKVISTDIPLGWDDVKDTVVDYPLDTDVPIEGDISIPDVGNPSIGSFWQWLLDILKAILNAIKSVIDAIKAIPNAILSFFVIDWDLVGEHVVYDEIFKNKFKPFYDVTYLLKNINANPSTHSGKFYMIIPPEMGGDGLSHCVLDLTVANDFISIARSFINASIWIGFLWYILKLFSPKLNIG